MTIRLHLTSVFVDDQDEALRFYTDVLGFEPRVDAAVGSDHRWITVGAPGQDIELLLEPAGHPAVAPYREALAADGVPLASFAVDDVDSECERLRAAGVTFTQRPADMGPVRTAVLDDGCGNLIQLLADLLPPDERTRHRDQVNRLPHPVPERSGETGP